MPCTVTDDEIRYYEREANLKRYGLELTNAQVAARVACETITVLRAHEQGWNQLSPLAKAWWEQHERDDAFRAAKAKR